MPSFTAWARLTQCLAEHVGFKGGRERKERNACACIYILADGKHMPARWLQIDTLHVFLSFFQVITLPYCMDALKIRLKHCQKRHTFPNLDQVTCPHEI